MNANTGSDPHWRTIVGTVSRAYRAADPHAARFARSKLSRDPVFKHVLRQGLIAPGAAVLDLGCGQGLLAACLAASADAARRRQWPGHWAPAPVGTTLVGLDLSETALRRAEAIAVEMARFEPADMRRAVFPACDVIACIDTLHYLPIPDQDDVLRRACKALRPGGVLLLRVGDSSSPLRWRLGLRIDQVTRWVEGGGFEPVYGRRLESWRDVVESLGMSFECRPMNGRLPFANRLLVARRRGDAAVDDLTRERSTDSRSEARN